MAWTPSPEVAAARDFGKKFGFSRVLILFDNGTNCGYVSYGETVALCNSAQRIGDNIWDTFVLSVAQENAR